MLIHLARRNEQYFVFDWTDYVISHSAYNKRYTEFVGEWVVKILNANFAVTLFILPLKRETEPTVSYFK